MESERSMWRKGEGAIVTRSPPTSVRARRLYSYEREIPNSAALSAACHGASPWLPEA